MFSTAIIIGEMVPPLSIVNKIIIDNNLIFDEPSIVNLIKTNISVDLLYIGKHHRAMEIFNWYVSIVKEGGLIILENIQEFIEKSKNLYIDDNIPSNPEILGYYETMETTDKEITIRKRLIKRNIKYAVIMASYYRSGGNSRKYVERAIKHLEYQRYGNYKLFLIGDNYTDREEFESFSSLLPVHKIQCINLNKALERESITDRYRLWCVAGVNAMNVGIGMAKEQGYTHYVHLDDDDFWLGFHLENITLAYQQFPESCFVATLGIKDNYSELLPRVGHLGYNNYIPVGCTAFHSSYGFRLDKIPLLYRSSFPECDHQARPADADMLDRLGNYCTDNGLKSLVVPIISLIYDTRTHPL